ncbi:J domain-containing protein [Halocalculus aciditolerans]|uniref:J domain-containing protein n=1 Tax=Halocalculus aciditolerans TaxID=1383812 RepID=A0A830FI49_9EURY|nr:J domain-containing protein [Halocalculus aciditolerans]GGL57467.1 hypothetical protein GCM10009039_14550 [Halocalculus aciditolerans]
MTRLDWPDGFERTASEARSPNRSYDVSLAKAFDDLERELVRLDVDDYRYSFDAEQRQRDGRPYSRASPDDPGFVLRWTMEGDQYAVACDAYSRLRDNVRTVYHYVSEKRMMGSRPVKTGGSEFANARLPPGDEDAVDGTVVAHSRPPHEVLGVDADAPENVVKAAYRALTKEHHPDHGGSNEKQAELNAAREAMLDE